MGRSRKDIHRQKERAIYGVEKGGAYNQPFILVY